jgi:SAM-dependent methyltransferase
MGTSTKVAAGAPSRPWKGQEIVSAFTQVKTGLAAAGKVRLRRVVPYVAPSLMQFSSFWPHDYQARSYARPAWQRGHEAADGLPMPPQALWATYCTTEESYLASGKEDCDAMAKAMAESGAALEDAGRILDLGCAAGRMTRHVMASAPDAQVWGADIWATAILWCQENLHPRGQFVVTTMLPHLPFEDRSFGLVYCGSLFTHIDDLTETWFTELHRIIRPGGRLYFSINDRNAVEVFEGRAEPGSYPAFWERTGGKAVWDRFVTDSRACPEYGQFKNGDAYMFTRGRSLHAQVMWDADALCERLEWGFKRCSVTPQGYGHQTTVLLERV